MPSELETRLAAALAPAYELEGEIGRGGMALVYRARDTRLKRGAAVKVLPPELAFRDDIRSRFLREAEMAARLSHPNIVPIYSVDERDGLVYFVMGLVQGGSVGDRIRKNGAFDIPTARRILREIADALAYAHAHGVVHRDIKPDNVLLDAETGRAMVTDFGIARAASDDDSGGTRLTATGVAIGTPAYMSPEQCAGDRAIDGRSDLYSLGTVAYQMLTGEPPFIGTNTPSIMVKHVTEQPVPLRQRRGDVPEDLERIVMRLLEKDPANRFPDGASLVAALDGAPVPPLKPVPQKLEGTPWVQDLQRLTNADPQLQQKITNAVQRAIEVRDARLMSRDERRRRKRGDDLPATQRVNRIRRRFVSYAGTSAVLFVVNSMTGDGFWWCFFPMAVMGVSVLADVGRLWADGIPMSAVLGGHIPESVPSAPSNAAGAIAAPSNDNTLSGPFGGVLRQAMADDKTIKELLAKLTDTERKMLPDVKSTADALFTRIQSLAAALHRMDQQAGGARLPDLDARIAELEEQGGIAESTERARRLSLLKRQRVTVAELTSSRTALLEQYESAGLLLQNLALDMLKVRSSGLDSAINGINSATQEARALSREIGYVLSAADELNAKG